MPNTISDNLQRLQNAKNSISTAITNRGGTVNPGDGLEEFPSDISSIPNIYSNSDEGKVVNNGALVAQTSDTTTENGVVDTTLISSLTVDVPSGGITLRGETTTPLTDRCTTNPIIIDGNSYTAVNQDAVFYGNKEFVFDGTMWHEFGDMPGIADGSNYGVVKLSDSVSSAFDSDDGVAATPNAVKIVNDGLTDTKKQVYLSELPYKNLLENTHEHNISTYNGITYNNTFFYGGSITDCRIAVSGEVPSEASGGASYFDISTSLTLEPGTYVLTGCPSGGSATTYRLRAYLARDVHVTVADDTGGGETFTLNQTTEIGVRIYICPDAGSIQKVFFPMICTKFIYDIDSTYVPFTNRIGKVSQYGLVKVSDSLSSTSGENDGVAATPSAVKTIKDILFSYNDKNLLALTNSGTLYGGIIYTPNYNDENGSVRAYRTSQSSYSSFYHISKFTKTLGIGQYILTGCPSGGSNSTYRLFAYYVVGDDAIQIASDTGSGAEFTLTEPRDVRVRIEISSSVTSIDKIFRPMICLKSVYNIDSTFVPGINIIANDDRSGVVRLSDLYYDPVSASSGGVACTTKGVKDAYDDAISKGTRTGNASTKGQVMLSDAVDSDYDVSDGVSATPKAVKLAYDKANEGYGKANAGLPYKNFVCVKRTASSVGTGIIYEVISDRTSPDCGKVLVSGNKTSDSYYDVSDIPILLPAGTYMLSGCPSGGSSTSYRLNAFEYNNLTLLATDMGSGRQFTLASTTAIIVRINISANTNIPSTNKLVFSPMVCLKSVYDIDNSFVPGRIPMGSDSVYGMVKLSDNYALDSNSVEGIAATPLAVKSVYTIASSASTEASNAYTAATTKAKSNVFGIVKLTDVADVAHDASESIASTPTAVKKAWDKADAGMLYKNLLCVRRTESSYLYNNIRYDVVSNQSLPDCGYIYVYGNNNGAASDVSYYVVNDRQVYLDPGEYILTGCPAGGSTTTYKLRAHNVENGNIAIATDVGSGSTFTVTSRIAVQVRIYIYPAAGSISTSSKKVFMPMICLKSAYDVDSFFMPGRFPVGTDAVYGTVKLTDTADVDHDAYEGIAASATAVHKAYSLANTANTAASTANTSLANKVQTIGYQTGTSPYFYYNNDGSSTKTSFCSMATSVSSSSTYPVTSKAVANHLSSNYYTASTVDSEISDAISDRPQVVYCNVNKVQTTTTLTEISGFSYTLNGSYTYRITASLGYTATKTSQIEIWARSVGSTADGYCWASATNSGSSDIGMLTCSCVMTSTPRVVYVRAKSQATGNNNIVLLVEKLPLIP